MEGCPTLYISECSPTTRGGRDVCSRCEIRHAYATRLPGRVSTLTQAGMLGRGAHTSPASSKWVVSFRIEEVCRVFIVAVGIVSMG